MMTDLTLTCRRVIKASPEQIYKAWLDPATIIKYMTMGPEMQARDARTDPRVGGRFHFVMVGEKESQHEGSYTDLTPYSRIAFTWESPYSAPESHVELLLTPVAGGTEVVLNHVKFLSEDSRDGHFKGWTSILGRLEGLIS